MSESAVCVRSAPGAVACANLGDAQGPHFRALNLLGVADGLLADRLNLCITRGPETYCLSDALWLPTNARAKEFGIFRRAFALDGADHLGRINTDPARWSKDGSFLVKSVNGGGNYLVDNVEPWIQAQVSTNEEACGLTREGKVACYRAASVKVEPVEDEHSPPNRISLTNVVPVALPKPAQTLALSDSYSCALLGDGQVYCWLPPVVGGTEQRLAAAATLPVYPQAFSPFDTPIEPAPRIASKIELPTPATTLVAGSNFVCALGQNHRVYCFGGNNWGQLGQVHPIAGSRQPLPVQHLGDVTHLAAAGSSVCAIETSGAVYCWGKLAGNHYQLSADQFSRVPRRITVDAPNSTAPERGICPQAMQVKLDPEDWVRRLNQAKGPVEQAELVEQMLMAPAKAANSLSIEPPVLRGVTLQHSRNSPTLASTWLVRTDWTIGSRDTSTRSQLLVPVSSGTYCAVAPDELGVIDREVTERPCRSHPSLGKFDGPYRAHFITLTSEDHWALEVFSASGRVDLLTDHEFHYEVTYYDQAGFDVRRVFNMELFGGTCPKSTGNSQPALSGVTTTRTFKLTQDMPRVFLIQDCEPGSRCTNLQAAYIDGSYDIAEQ